METSTLERTTTPKIYVCDVCHSDLLEMSACGSTSYFCPSCNLLKSRSKIILKTNN